MISEQAQAGFDFIFKKSIKSNINTKAGFECDIEPLVNMNEITEKEFAVLTTSSSRFRLFTIFHFNSKEAYSGRFNDELEESIEIEKTSSFRDNFLEFCNVCCGAINRELHKIYDFLGLSTPYVLLHECADYITELNPGFVKHYRVTINYSSVLHATLCVCDFGVVDFKVDTTEVEESTGELELF